MFSKEIAALLRGFAGINTSASQKQNNQNPKWLWLKNICNPKHVILLD